ncbi:hypothetical protein [Winogradskyella sp. 4-2091]|uniref:hypothetical protein n=1 Tax=Winogradskyella sp. 4-2091 TaxID=3381659 RepID=UPI0038924DDA
MDLIEKIINKKSRVIFLLIFLSIAVISAEPFSLDDKRNINDANISIFPFTINDSATGKIKSAFFARDSYNSFLKLKDSVQVLFVSSASYASSVNKNANYPVGFCAENGKLLNKIPHQTMDGLVLIHNNEPEINTMQVIDLDKENYTCNDGKCYPYFSTDNIRNNPEETFSFIDLVETQNISSFQTQLVYTNYKSDKENFKNLTNGDNDRSRRFLAICEKDNQLYHIILDSTEENYLMTSALDAIDYLRQANYDVRKMINLDTGSKDIMYVREDGLLKNYRPNPLTSSSKIENAASLLVYYRDL